MNARRSISKSGGGAPLLVLALGLFLALFPIITNASGQHTVFRQNFETNTAGWLTSIGVNNYGAITRVATGTDGVTSSGGAWHAKLSGNPSGAPTGPFSRFGAYQTLWSGGFTASVDIYLDVDWADGQGFDYSVAANKQDNNHLRDFIWHVGKVNGSLLVNASNNSDGNFNAWKLQNENAGNFFTIPTSGWYTFKHVFRDNAGNLTVDLELYNSAGTKLHTITRTTTDNIASVVGGNRYAWFVFINVNGGINIDNHTLAYVNQPPVHNATQDLYFYTIQSAIDAATAGDTINVAAGTYTEEISLNKAVTIEGANAGIAAGAYPATRGAETILNGGFIVSASGAKIDGFTIQNGRTSGGLKVGVAVATSNVTIANTIIENVSAPAQSDGISTQPGNNNLTVTNSTIRNNWRGIYLNPGSGHVLTGNLIQSNNGVGVGIGSDGLSNTTLVGNIFTGNTLEGWGSSAVGANVSAQFNVFNGGTNGIYHYGGNAISAINNWWGNASGPTHASNTGGTGAIVSNNVLFDPWLGNAPVVASNASGTINGPVANFNVTYTGSDSPLIILSQFATNPGAASSLFGSGTQFFDINVEAGTTGSIDVTMPAAGASGKLQWFDGTDWLEVSDSAGNPVLPSGGVYAFTLSDSAPSSPKLAQLTGTPFAGGAPEVWMELAPGYDNEFAQGETVEVIVKAASSALYGVDISLSYPTGLKVTKVVLGGSSTTNANLYADTVTVNSAGSGAIRFAFSQRADAHPNNVDDAEIDLATITFLALPAALGAQDIEFDGSINPLLFTDKDGNNGVAVTPVVVGTHPLVLDVTPSPTVFVDVALQGRSDYAGLQLELKPAVTGNILYDASAAAHLEILAVPAGIYTARVSAPKYLAAVQNFTLPDVASYDLGSVLTLRGGDINADDQINIQDLVLIGVSFGSTTVLTADINGDNVVNIQDLAIAAGNYGLKTVPASGNTYPAPWQ